VAARVRSEPDALIQEIVDGWAWFSDGARARALGMKPDADLQEIIETFVAEELDGKFVAGD
jgi:hypothetical protein